MPPGLLITELRRKRKFESDLKSQSREVQDAARAALKALLQCPIPQKLRAHSLSGYRNPKLFTIDVFTNKSYKISFEIEGTCAVLRRIGTHKEIDHCP